MLRFSSLVIALLMGPLVSHAAPPSIESLTAELEALTPQVERFDGRIASAQLRGHVYDHVVMQAAILVDPYENVEARQRAAVWLSELPSVNPLKFLDARLVEGRQEALTESAKALGALVHEKSFGFVASAARDRDPLLRETVIAVAPTWGDSAVRMLQERAKREVFHSKLQRLALDGLASIGSTAAADALYAIASDTNLNEEAAEHARSLLTEHFAAYLAEKGGLPGRNSDSIGQGAVVAGSGVVGGVLLSSVGVWGQSDLGVGVGLLGGTAIGVGGGYLYTRDRPISRGQGLRYSSNVVWGLAGSQMVNTSIGGDENFDALVRTVGVSAGAWLGYRAMENDPAWGDVLETNVAGILGATTALSIHSLATAARDSHREQSMEMLSEAARERLSEVDYRRRDREVGLTLLAGSAAGLGVGTALQGAWEPDSVDLGASVLGAFVVSDAFGIVEKFEPFDRHFYEGEWRTVGSNLGLIGGLTAAHHLDSDWNMVGLSAGYSAIGKVAGHGLGELLRLEDRALVSTPLSLAGTIGGAVAAGSLRPGQDDLAAVSLGTAVVTANVGVLNEKLLAMNAVKAPTADGSTLLVGAATAGGLLAASNGFQVEPDRSLFVTTGAGWGVYYGSLAQLMIPGELEFEDAALITVGVMDLGIGAAAYLTSDAGGVDPRDTFVPQLIGVAGGTLGALGVMLANASPEAIAAGALLGSTAGLAGGAMVGPKLKRQQKPRTKASLGIDAPGVWSFLALPSVNADGSLGGNVQLNVTGL